jgi:hypothetical protein
MYTAGMFSKVNAVFRGEPKAGQSFLAAKAKKKKKKKENTDHYPIYSNHEINTDPLPALPGPETLDNFPLAGL